MDIQDILEKSLTKENPLGNIDTIVGSGKDVYADGFKIVKYKKPIVINTDKEKLEFLFNYAEKFGLDVKHFSQSKYGDAVKYHTQHTFDSDFWNNALSDDQRRAIKSYTGYVYRPMNEILRKGSTDKVHPSAVANVKQMIDNMTSALSKSVTKERLIVSRGLQDANGFAKTLGLTSEQLKDPAVIQDRGFYSSACSIDSGFSGPKIYTIVPKGTQGMYVNPISEYPTENEFIIQRNTT